MSADQKFILKCSSLLGFDGLDELELSVELNVSDQRSSYQGRFVDLSDPSSNYENLNNSGSQQQVDSSGSVYPQRSDHDTSQ